MSNERKGRVLVTGAGQRIGQTIAIALANIGYDIAIHYNSSEKGALETKRQVESLGGRAELFQADLLEPNAPQSLAEQVLRSFGGLEVLINNASAFPEPANIVASSSLAEQTLAEWEQLMTINARAPFFLIQALSSALKASGQGSIINILDTSASEPFLSRAAHSVSKGALASVTTLAAKALYGQVRVNALEFGAILPPAGLAKTAQETLAWAGVGAATSAIIFLLQSNFIHGEIIKVDQGATRFGGSLLG